jgi:hypothetical protein
MTDKKKLAAISAVVSMLSNETAASEYVPKQPVQQPTQWSSWGRQQTMSYRDTVQRHIIKRNK